MHFEWQAGQHQDPEDGSGRSFSASASPPASDLGVGRTRRAEFNRDVIERKSTNKISTLDISGMHNAPSRLR